MNLRLVSHYLSLLLLTLAAFIILPLALALWDWSLLSIKAYGITLVLMLLASFVMWSFGKYRGEAVHRVDAFGIVTFIWLLIGLFGALPFWLEGAISSPFSALFEAISGFTTTGATVVADVDGLSRATNLWRCLSHWIGGMGIVVLFVAIFPQLGIGAKHLFRTEVPGPISEGLKPRIKQTALRLWWVYMGLTLLCTVLLYFFGMTVYEALCHALSILSTGGFSTRGASIGAFKNPYIEWVCIFFMLIGGLNFGLYYAALHGKISQMWKNYELRLFLAINVFVSLVLTYFLIDSSSDVLAAYRTGLFQTLAVTTTTGLMTDDFDRYPDVARFLLFLCMFIGGCAGSTAGGIKVSRVFIASKAILNELKHVIHPQLVTTLKVGKQAISQQIVSGIMIFICVYFLIFATCSFVLVATGLDLITAMSAVIASLSSIGPGLAGVGPVQNYEFIPALGKLVLCFCMIAGRLEIFALLAIFTKDVWKK